MSKYNKETIYRGNLMEYINGTSTIIKENIELTASWTKTPEIYNYYTVTFLIGDRKETTTVKEGEIVKPLNAPNVKGYTFKAWYLDDKQYDFNIPVTSAITLTAKYQYNLLNQI